MAQSNSPITTLSKESAQFILEGLKFFDNYPQAQEWRNLDRAVFLLLARDIAQFYPNESENLDEYLVRLKTFLQRVINKQEQAPSLPPNLDQLVEAFEEFKQKENGDAQKKAIADIPTSQNVSLEDWIKRLQQEYCDRKIAATIEKVLAPLKISPEKKAKAQKALTTAISSSIPQTAVASSQEKNRLQNSLTAQIEQLNQTSGAVFTDQEKNLIRKQAQEKITNQASYLTVPLASRPIISSQQKEIRETISQVILSQALTKDPTQADQIAEAITQALAEKVPKLKKQEGDSLGPVGRASLVEATINASLPEISQALTGRAITSLNPQDSQGFLQSLAANISQPLIGLSVSLRENWENQKNQKKLLRSSRGLVLQTLIENPLLPYQVTPKEGLASLGEQMRAVVKQFGFNSHSAEIISYKNEEASGLANAVLGQTSRWWQNQYHWRQSQGDNDYLSEQAKKNWLNQLNFEKNFPDLGNFYSHIISLSGPRRIFEQIFSPLRSWFGPKPGSWWLSKISFTEELAKTAQSKAGLFFQKALSSFNIFQLGAEKIAKKGASKALVWIGKKFGATKLGSILGSIIPGIGNIVGGAVGFGLDLIKGGANLFTGLLNKISGESEIERSIKANLGPLGELILSPISLIIGGTLIIIIFLSLNLFQIEGGALIADEEVVSGLPFTSLPSEQPTAENYLAERIIKIIQECPASRPYGYVNSKNFAEIKECLSSGGISSSAISIMAESIRSYDSLQCVGFVQAIERELSRSLPGCGDAKAYADCDLIRNSQVYEYVSCQELKVGAIAIATGGTYGHVGIITKIETTIDGVARLRFASAWGVPYSNNGGKVTVTTLTCDSFAAFIQTRN